MNLWIKNQVNFSLLWHWGSNGVSRTIRHIVLDRQLVISFITFILYLVLLWQPVLLLLLSWPSLLVLPLFKHFFPFCLNYFLFFFTTGTITFLLFWLLFCLFAIFSNIAFVTTVSIIAIVICLALLLSWPLRVLFCSFAICLSQSPMGLSMPLVLFPLLTRGVSKGFLWWVSICKCHSLTLHWQIGSSALTWTHYLIWKWHSSLLHSLMHPYDRILGTRLSCSWNACESNDTCCTFLTVLYVMYKHNKYLSQKQWGGSNFQ